MWMSARLLKQYASPLCLLAAGVLVAGSAKADLLIMPTGSGQEWGEGPTGQFDVLLNPPGPAQQDLASFQVTLPMASPYSTLWYSENSMASVNALAVAPAADVAPANSFDAPSDPAPIANSGTSTLQSNATLSEDPPVAASPALQAVLIDPPAVTLDPPVIDPLVGQAVVAPEPPVWAMLVFAAPLLWFWRRRRRGKSAGSSRLP